MRIPSRETPDLQPAVFGLISSSVFCEATAVVGLEVDELGGPLFLLSLLVGFAVSGASFGALALFFKGGSFGFGGRAGFCGCSSGIRLAPRSFWFRTHEWTLRNRATLPIDDLDEQRVGLCARMRGVGGACELVQLQRLSSWSWVFDFGESGGDFGSFAVLPREDGSS